MDREVQRFLEVEERASALVEALQRLYEEANMHRAATQELKRAYEGLAHLVTVLKDLVTGNQDVLRLFREIRAQDIIEKLLVIEKGVENGTASLEDLRNVVLEKTEALSQDVTTIGGLLATGLDEIAAKLRNTLDSCGKGIERIDARVMRESLKMHETLARMQHLLLLTLGMAFAAAVLGVIGIFR